MSQELPQSGQSHHGQLPTGWCWAVVDEVIDLCQYGSSAKTDENPSGIPVLRMGNIQEGRLDLSNLKYLPHDHHEFPNLILQEEDLLFNRTNSVELVGKSAVYLGQPSPCSYASYLVALRLGAACDSKYLCYFLNSHHGKVWVRSVVSQQVGQANVNSTKLRALQFPLAPSNEQRRIVAKIEELISDLDAGLVALKRIKANLKRYRAAVLKAAVEGSLTEEWRAKHPKTEPATKLLERILAQRRQKWEEDQLAKFAAADKTPPRGWREKYVEPTDPDTSGLPELPLGWIVASLEQITDAHRPICYGILMPKENVAEGVLYVKVKDMKGDRIDLASLHRTRREIAEEYSRASLKSGDLLLAIRGTYGRVANVPPELDGGNITQDTARLAIRGMDSDFVAIALRSFDCQSYFKRVARGVAVKGVNIGDVKLCPIPIPPLEEQLQIVPEVAEKLSQIEAAEVAIDHSIKRAARLRQSILKRAFEGRLVPQDPTDEPADKLLDRIRQERASANGSMAPRTRRERASKRQAEGETHGATS